MSPVIYELSMMGEHYLKNIMIGKKKFEGRIHTEKYASMRVGDILKLYENEAGWGIVCSISSIQTFSSFKEMLETLGVLSLLPQLEPLSYTSTHDALIAEAVHIYESFPGSERVDILGCMAIGVNFLHQY